MTPLESAIEEIVARKVDERLKALGLTTVQATPESFRLKAGHTMEQLEFRCAVSHVTIGRVERGEVKRLRPGTLGKIADALGVDRGSYFAAAMRVRKSK